MILRIDRQPDLVYRRTVFSFTILRINHQPDLFHRRTVFSFTVLRTDLRQWRNNLVRIHSGMAMGLPQQN